MGNKVSLIVPTYNAGDKWIKWIYSVIHQSIQPNVIVLDSESTDKTVKLARDAGLTVLLIPKSDFNHGGTRQKGVGLSQAEFVVFLTQDAVLADENALERLIRCFDNPNVGVAYGRQLPHEMAGPIGAHARLFNYPKQTLVKTFNDAAAMGIKTAFISNSFAAYRKTALVEVGGFPQHTILSEDTFVAAKMLLAGWQIAYCAEAEVYHSHDYSMAEEFKRYFDIGVFHAHETWIQKEFGRAEGEGLKFVLSEGKYIIRQGKAYLLFSAFIRNCLKYIGYRLGLREKNIPIHLKKMLSMHSQFWNFERRAKS